MKLTDKKLLLLVLFFFILIPISTHATKQLPTVPLHQSIAPTKNYVEGEIIVKYKNTSQKEIQSLDFLSLPQQVKKDVTLENQFENIHIAVIKSQTKSTNDLLKELQNNPNIEYAEPNYIKIAAFIPNDPYFTEDQWAHDIDDPDNDTDIDSTDAWNIESNTAQSTTLAVIDSGVDYDFNDLTTNMWDGSSNCLSDTGASITCPNHGWDYANNDNDPDDTAHPTPGFQGHGTYVSSIFGAITNNSIGMSGISRYNSVKIMALRFNLDISSEIRAINFAKNNGAKVINASFSGESYSQAEKDVIESFPGIFVTASGNGGSDSVGDNNDNIHQYPCNYSSTNIICVGAYTDDGNLATFSNYGESVDIAAPGTDILGIQHQDYYLGDGTSFASPLVAGTAALLYSHKPSASISTIKNTLLSSSDHVSVLSNTIACSRRLNLYNALQNTIANNIPLEICGTPIYRLYNTKTGVHLYTRGEADRNKVLAKWPEFEYTDGGPAFWASLTQNTGLTAIYRLYNTKTGVHLYTRGEADRNKVLAKWPEFEYTDGGPTFYASLTN